MSQADILEYMSKKPDNWHSSRVITKQFDINYKCISSALTKLRRFGVVYRKFVSKVNKNKEHKQRTIRVRYFKIVPKGYKVVYNKKTADKIVPKIETFK